MRQLSPEDLRRLRQPPGRHPDHSKLYHKYTKFVKKYGEDADIEELAKSGTISVAFAIALRTYLMINRETDSDERGTIFRGC